MAIPIASILLRMALRTRHRQQQTAQVHLREQYQDNAALVEEFIMEIEGTGKTHDVQKLRRRA